MGVQRSTGYEHLFFRIWLRRYVCKTKKFSSAVFTSFYFEFILYNKQTGRAASRNEDGVSKSRKAPPERNAFSRKIRFQRKKQKNPGCVSRSNEAPGRCCPLPHFQQNTLHTPVFLPPFFRGIVGYRSCFSEGFPFNPGCRDARRQQPIVHGFCPPPRQVEVVFF